MQDVNVVVVFYSRTGSTERLAQVAAVGAVQGRANIRLRWLMDAADDAAIAGAPAWKETRERMKMEYVAPRDADAAWADAILVGMPAEMTSLPPEYVRYFDSLKAAGKIGASFSGCDALDTAMRAAGLTVATAACDPDPLTSARLLGRRVAEAARSRKRQ